MPVVISTPKPAMKMPGSSYPVTWTPLLMTAGVMHPKLTTTLTE